MIEVTLGQAIFFSMIAGGLIGYTISNYLNSNQPQKPTPLKLVKKRRSPP